MGEGWWKWARAPTATGAPGGKSALAKGLPVSHSKSKMIRIETLPCVGLWCIFCTIVEKWGFHSFFISPVILDAWNRAMCHGRLYDSKCFMMQDGHQPNSQNLQDSYPPWNIARVSQKESHLPTIHFQGRTVSGRVSLLESLATSTGPFSCQPTWSHPRRGVKVGNCG